MCAQLLSRMRAKLAKPEPSNWRAVSDVKFEAGESEQKEEAKTPEFKLALREVAAEMAQPEWLASIDGLIGLGEKRSMRSASRAK